MRSDSSEANHSNKFEQKSPSRPLCYIISINQKKFQRLDKDLQDAIIRAGKIASEKFAKKYDADMKNEIAEMEKAGTKVTYATEKDYEAWQSLPTCEGNIQTWLAEADKVGLPDAENTFKQIRSIVEKYLK